MTYLRQLLPELAQELASANAGLHVLLNEDAYAQLGASLSGWGISVHTPKWANRPGPQRLISEQALLPRLLQRLAADAVFHTGDILPLRSNVPNVLLCRNMLLYAPLGKHSPRLRGLRYLARQSLRSASAVAFVSRTLADRAIQTRDPPKSWKVIHHGPGLSVPPANVSPDQRSVAMVIVSSLYDYKRIELAIEAVEELRRRELPASLDVVGRAIEGSYVAKLRREVQERRLEGLVRFAGEGSPSRVMEAYQRATLAVVTSANESFCHPILEAFSARIPVMVPTDLAVAREIAGEAAAYAVPDGRGFADAAQRLICDRARYRDFVTAGTDRLGTFSWQKAARETANLILSCCRREPRGAI